MSAGGQVTVKVSLDFAFELFSLESSDPVSERLFGDLRGVDPETCGLGVEIPEGPTAKIVRPAAAWT
jgi:hypothetical protein